MPDEQLSLFPLDNHQAAAPQPRPGLTLSDPLEAALSPFEQHMAERDLAENTRAAFRNDLKLFLEYMGPQTPIQACGQERLEAFLDYLQNERGAPCTARSLDRRITTLKFFFGWLLSTAVLPEDPAAGLVRSGYSSKTPRIASEGEIERVLGLTREMRDRDEKPDARPHLLVTLLLDAALKKTECMNLELADLDVSDPRHASVQIAYQRRRQRFKSRRLAVSPDWARTLPLYLAQYKPTVKLFECTGRNLEYLLHNIATEAGLPYALTFAMLRWTSAVRSLKTGMDEKTLRERLGLSRIAWQEAGPLLHKLAQGPL